MPQVSSSSAFVPPESKHNATKVTVRTFGCLTEDSFLEKIGSQTSRIWKPGKIVVTYASENDVAGSLKILFEDLIAALGLSLDIVTEVGVWEVRPDMWVITDINKLPVAAIEVKKPADIMNEPTVLGELFDAMKQLQHFYGRQLAIGILATGAAFRVCWFGDDDNVDMSKEEVFRIRGAEPSTPASKVAASSERSPPNTPSKRYPAFHALDEEDDGGADGGGDDGADDSAVVSDRQMCVSEIVQSNSDNHGAMRLLAGALMKMSRVTATVLSSPFENLKKRHVIRFEKDGHTNDIVWCTLPKLDGHKDMSKVAKPRKYLFAIEDLGRGADGRVWLTCTCSGAVCVLKFASDSGEKARDLLQREHEQWRNVYRGAPFVRHVALETWSGRLALRLPHFSYVPEPERHECLHGVRGTLIHRFVANKVQHKDVKWSNIGRYKDRDSQVLIVFDLAVTRVVAVDSDSTDTDAAWVDEAIASLSRGLDRE